MSKFWLLVKQLYKEKIKGKLFFIMIAIYVGAISIVMFWPDIKAAFFESEALEIAVVNETDADIEDLFQSNDDLAFSFPTASNNDVEKEVIDGDYAAAIFIKDEANSLTAEIATYEPLAFTDQLNISSTLQYAGKLYEVQQLDLSAEEADQILQSETVITMKNLDEASIGGKSEDEKAVGILASMLVGSLIYGFLISFSTMITSDVASEKGSRVLEVLLASVKPSTHLIAKLTGTFLLAITQIGALILILAIIFMTVDGGSKVDSLLPMIEELSYSYIGYAIAFLVLSIVLNLIIGALLGSLVSKVEEASQAMTPLMIIGLVGFYVLIFGAQSPDTMLVKIFSYIPFTSGMVMPLRIGATDIGTFEPMLALVILAVTSIIAFVISLSFYKRSVLTYSTGGMIQKIKTMLKVTT